MIALVGCVDSLSFACWRGVLTVEPADTRSELEAEAAAEVPLLMPVEKEAAEIAGVAIMDHFYIPFR